MDGVAKPNTGRMKTDVNNFECPNSTYRMVMKESCVPFNLIQPNAGIIIVNNWSPGQGFDCKFDHLNAGDNERLHVCLHLETHAGRMERDQELNEIVIELKL